MLNEPLAVDRVICRSDPDHFEDWYVDLIEKAGHRVDSCAAQYLWERGYGIMDALVKITHS